MVKKWIFFLTMSLVASLPVCAQEDLEADVKVDLVSNHVWRGQHYGNASIQPFAEVRWYGAYVNMFGSTGFSKDDIERIDVSLGYRAPFGLNVGVGTHWMSGIDEKDRFFYFKPKDCGHKFEANIGYSHRYFSLQAYTIVYGNDFKINGDRAFSTYIELTVPFRLATVDWQAKVGFSPMESAGWKTAIEDNFFFDSMNDYLYGKGPTVVLASLRAQKSFKIAGYDVPVFVEFDSNPYTQKAYGVAGISFCPFKK